MRANPWGARPQVGKTIIDNIVASSNISSVIFDREPETGYGRICDTKGHGLPFVFKPAVKVSESPLLVILHGNGGNDRPARFQSDDWNVLCPLDKYGYKNYGCWWLGENGRFWVMGLLYALIEHLKSQYSITKGLYMWGSSMGGYGAILHGTILQADAIFAHVPQINCFDSHWADANRDYMQQVFGFNLHPFQNLAYLMEYFDSARAPLYFFSFNRFDRVRYMEDHCMTIIDACNKNKFNYMLLVHPQKGHKLYHTIAQHVEYFNMYSREIVEK